MFMFCIVVFLLQATLIYSGGITYLSTATSSNYLTSPNYPNYYDRYEDERWLITAVNSSHVINLNVVYSSLESSSACLFDYVAVYDGQDTLYPRLVKFCGYSSPNLVSTGSVLYIHFISDGSIEGNGFRIRYWSSVPNDQQSDDSSGLNVAVIVLGCLTTVAFIIIFLATLAYCHITKGKDWCRTCNSVVHVTPARGPMIVHISDSHFLWPDTYRSSFRPHRDYRQTHSMQAPPPYVPRSTNISSFTQHATVLHVQPAELPISPPPPYTTLY